MTGTGGQTASGTGGNGAAGTGEWRSTAASTGGNAAGVTGSGGQTVSGTGGNGAAGAGWRAIRVGQRWQWRGGAEVGADGRRAPAARPGPRGGGAARVARRRRRDRRDGGTGGAGHAGGSSGAGGAVTPPVSDPTSTLGISAPGSGYHVEGNIPYGPYTMQRLDVMYPNAAGPKGTTTLPGRHHVSRRRVDRQQAGGAEGEHVELLQPVPQTRLSRLQRGVPVGRRHGGRRHRSRRRPGRAPRGEVVLGSHGLLSRRQDPLRHHGRVGGRAAGPHGRDGHPRGPARTHQPHRLHDRRDRQRLRSGGRDRSSREERLLRRAVAPRQHARTGRRSPSRSAPSPTFARTSRRSSRSKATWTPRSP